MLSGEAAGQTGSRLFCVLAPGCLESEQSRESVHTHHRPHAFLGGGVYNANQEDTVGRQSKHIHGTHENIKSCFCLRFRCMHANFGLRSVKVKIRGDLFHSRDEQYEYDGDNGAFICILL